MKKLTLKQQAQQAHKIAALFVLLAESIDDFAPQSPMGLKIREKCVEVLPFADEMIRQVFNVPQISKTTYINGLATKIDTVIRHNYQNITNDFT